MRVKMEQLWKGDVEALGGRGLMASGRKGKGEDLGWGL